MGQVGAQGVGQTGRGRQPAQTVESDEFSITPEDAGHGPFVVNHKSALGPKWIHLTAVYGLGSISTWERRSPAHPDTDIFKRRWSKGERNEVGYHDPTPSRPSQKLVRQCL
jgi:hypothetical protein